MKSNWLGVVVVVLGSLLTSGCATMFNSGTQTIAVSAWESEKGQAVVAKVMVETPHSSFAAVTPFQITTYPSSMKDVTLTLDDPCYKKLSYTVQSYITPVAYLNILNLPMYGIGFGIDYLTGRMFEYEPQVTLSVQRVSQDGECNSGAATVAALPIEVERAAPRKTKWDIGFSVGRVDAGSIAHPAITADLNYFFLPRMSLGAQFSTGGTYVYDSSYSAPVQINQDSLLIAVHYFLRDFSGLYVGVASGLRTLEVKYLPYFTFSRLGNTPTPTGGTARLEYVPLLLQVGWRSAGPVSLGVDLAASTSRLGLGNPRSVSETNTLEAIGLPETRRLALNAYREFQHPLELHFRVAIAF